LSVLDQSFRTQILNIHEVDGIGVHTGDGIAAMGDRIGFEKARVRFFPWIGFDRYLFS
jgi:hypothetical protein